jgi:pimeloyl-ACP methyl ester carboxylesterase
VDYLPGQQGFRNTDFAHNPFNVGRERFGGGGAEFEAFLTQDLKPFIEARYPADPASSVLFGHSMGAVFAANVFANKPDAFAGYIIASFVEPRDPTVVDRVAKAARLGHGQRLFLAVGGDEDQTTSEKRNMQKGFADLAAALKSGGRHVILEAKSYPGENHLSYYPNVVIDGFRFALPPTVPVDLPVVSLPASATAHYAGAYDLPDGRRITIKVVGDSLLTAQVADGPPVYLLPNGANRYYAFTSDLDVRFDTNGLTLVGRAAPSTRAKRVKGAN